jgi:hypothetical protein
MTLYDILQDGFHTPLNATQIGELFHAGRLGRHTRCKPLKQKEWRTIDELFPLLKYHSPLQFSYEPPDSEGEFRFRRSIVVATCLVGAATATAVIYLYSQSQHSLNRSITAVDSISTSAAPAHGSRAPFVSTQPIQNTVYASTTSPGSNGNVGPVVVQSFEETNTQAAIRLAEAQRINEQTRRNQAVADQERALKQQKLLEQQKAAGRDQHVLLDHWQTVNVGGYGVSVKIHDNDTTSFDVWINGELHRDVRKEKGITHSGMDETLIYSNGRATLYYVWEISGELNHCLLRVRDS